MVTHSGDIVFGPSGSRKKLGDERTLRLPGSVVHPSAMLGVGVLVQEGATIGHDSIICDWATICPGVHLAGTVVVGEGAWLGLGVLVKQGLTIGEWAFVGQGANVVEDIPPRVLAYGNPCRVIRPLKEDEIGTIIT